MDCYTAEDKLEDLVLEGKQKCRPDLFGITTMKVTVNFLIEIQDRIKELKEKNNE